MCGVLQSHLRISPVVSGKDKKLNETSHEKKPADNDVNNVTIIPSCIGS